MRKTVLITSLVSSGLVLAGLIVFAAYGGFRGPVKVVISKETTYLTEPIQSDGTVDYVEALNAEYGRGVTPENNAAIPLIHLLGPAFLDKSAPLVMAELRMAPLDSGQKRFLTLKEYFCQRNSNDNPNKKLLITAQVNASSNIGKNPLQQSFEKEERNLVNATHRPWPAEEYPLLAEWLKENQQPLDEAVRATSLPRYFLPLVTSRKPHRMADLEHPSYSDMRNLADALMARANGRLATEDIEGAWADLMAVSRLGHLLSQSPLIINRIIGAGFLEMAALPMRKALGHRSITSDQAHRFFADVQSLPPLPGLGDALDRGERFLQLDVVFAIAAARSSRLPFTLPKFKIGQIDWNVVLSSINQQFDATTASLALPTFAKREAALHEAEAFAQRKPAFTLSATKAFADILLRTGGNAVFRIASSYSRREVQLELETVAMALAVYNKDNGEYPAELSQLSPDYLTAVPLDHFTDQPLHYARQGQGFLLYSVGRNMRDDGGKNNGETDDVAVSDDEKAQ